MDIFISSSNIMGNMLKNHTIQGIGLGRSLVGIADSNSIGPPAQTFKSLLWMLCVKYRYLRQADPLSRGVIHTVSVSLSMIRHNKNPPHLQRLRRENRTKKEWKESITPAIAWARG